MNLDALVRKAQAQFEQIDPVDVPVLVGDERVTVRVFPVPGDEWRDLIAVHPPRRASDEKRVVTAEMDAVAGYNVDAVTKAYPRVWALHGEKPVPVPEDQWVRVCSVLSGPDLKALASVIWVLNERDPAKRVADAGKASPGGSRRKRRSPGSSESPSGS